MADMFFFLTRSYEWHVKWTYKFQCGFYFNGTSSRTNFAYEFYEWQCITNLMRYLCFGDVTFMWKETYSIDCYVND